MSKYIVVGNGILASQIREAGHDVVSLPDNTDFGMLIGNMSSLGQSDQIHLICTAQHLNLALTALPYVKKTVLAGTHPIDVDDGVVRVPSLEAAQIIAAAQGTPQQPTPPITPQQPTPPIQADMPSFFHSANPQAAEKPAAADSPASQQQTAAPPMPASITPAELQPVVSQQAIQKRVSDPLPESALSKAEFDKSTYDPSFKGAPWANQVEDRSKSSGLVISIAAAKGGAGKSTLTCWLTEALTASGVTTAIVDANIGQPDIAKMTGVWGQSSGIAALTGEQRFTDSELMEASQFVEGLGRVLGGPAKPLEEAPTTMLAAMALATERLAVHHEFVLVDTPVGTVYEPVFGKFVLHVADILLIVTNPHQPTVHDTVLWVHDITKPLEDGGFGWPRDKMIGVLNRANPNTDLDLDVVKAWAPNIDIVGDIPEIEGVIAAVNSGEWRCPKGAKEAVAHVAQQLCQSHPSISKQITDLRSSKSGDSSAKTQKKSGISKFFSKLIR